MRIYNRLSIVLALAIHSSTATPIGASCEITTDSGTLHGFVDPSSPTVCQFLGVPFALPPTGARRWLPPMGFNNSSVSINTTVFGPACPQIPLSTQLIPDVFSAKGGNRTEFFPVEEFSKDHPERLDPRIDGRGKTPHLGLVLWRALSSGGRSLTRTQGHIVVSTNYRVNIFGFPNAPGLADHNLRLLDQRTALEWVHMNIGAFLNFLYSLSPTNPIVHGSIMESGTLLLSVDLNKLAVQTFNPRNSDEKVLVAPAAHYSGAKYQTKNAGPLVGAEVNGAADWDWGGMGKGPVPTECVGACGRFLGCEFELCTGFPTVATFFLRPGPTIRIGTWPEKKHGPRGQGGPGGPAHLQGGTGGIGQGPIVNITTSQLIAPNLQAAVATDQASQLRNLRASQTASHCPPPSRIFCGRQETLNKMHHFFSDTGIQHTYVLHGFGGAGKTQIALKFIKGSSSRCLKNIAVLKDFGDSPQDGLLWLTSKVEEWLLLFDNADDPSINLNDFIPHCNHGNIIITSRNPGLRVYAGSNSSLVSDMEEKDAVALLLKSALQEATIHTEQSAAEIVKSLHYLPLAIVQAGAFISKSRDMDGYLPLYMKHQARLLSEKPAQSHDQYAWAVYTTWQILHYNGTPEEIFRYASEYQISSDGPSEEELEEPLEFLSHFLAPDGEWDSLQFLDATNEVQSYSLISFDAEKKVFSIHPLVHSWSQGTVQNPEGYMFTMGSILGMALSERPQWDMQLASLLLCPHIELAVKMDVEIALVFRAQYATIFWEGGRYQQATRLQEEVLEKQKQLLGADHPEILSTMGNLANSYSYLELNVLVLEKERQLLGKNHPDTLTTMGNLATSYSYLCEHQKAKELNVLVLEKQKQVLGENHPDTLSTMGNLASSYSYLREYKKAKELRILVLEKQKQILGENHSDTLKTEKLLGSTSPKLGKPSRTRRIWALFHRSAM
ncbi:hypothetical protein B0H16DRAFT_1472547 [Mycena metata]|uniref:Carboxylesterase type B domain-containing protein n=1 Tax=Mycena metata TaxID=1033252 RepID=A0AAD7HMY9_9AGAR|nr:hypothetical protein B0H16DRAFT_1472547 [Mycena metata]